MAIRTVPTNWVEALELSKTLTQDDITNHDYYQNQVALAQMQFHLGQPVTEYVGSPPVTPLGPEYIDTGTGDHYRWDSDTSGWILQGNFKGDTGATGPHGDAGVIDFTDDRLYDGRNIVKNPSACGLGVNGKMQNYEDQSNEAPAVFDDEKLYWAYDKTLIPRGDCLWESEAVWLNGDTYNSVSAGGPSPLLGLLDAMGYMAGESNSGHALRVLKITNLSGADRGDCGNINANRHHGKNLSVGLWINWATIEAGVYKAHGETVSPSANTWGWYTRNRLNQLPFQSPGMPDNVVAYIAAPVAFISTTEDTISAMSPNIAVVDGSSHASE